jgi:predicted MFS family arabinose efflux permease
MVGLVASAQGVGAIIGGIVISFLAQRFTRSTLVVGTVVTVCTLLTAYALAPNLTVLVGVVFVLGGAWSSLFITLSAVIQRDAPPASRGRVMSLMQATFGITYGLGLLFIGAIGDLVNLHVAFATGAVIGLVGFWLLTMRARNWRAAIDGEVAANDLQLATS